jgi:hypothetical protein
LWEREKEMDFFMFFKRKKKKKKVQKSVPSTSTVETSTHAVSPSSMWHSNVGAAMGSVRFPSTGASTMLCVCVRECHAEPGAKSDDAQKNKNQTAKTNKRGG